MLQKLESTPIEDKFIYSYYVILIETTLYILFHFLNYKQKNNFQYTIYRLLLSLLIDSGQLFQECMDIYFQSKIE